MIFAKDRLDNHNNSDTRQVEYFSLICVTEREQVTDLIIVIMTGFFVVESRGQGICNLLRWDAALLTC